MEPFYLTISSGFVTTGPIQFVGPVANKVNHTLLLELGVDA